MTRVVSAEERARITIRPEWGSDTELILAWTRWLQERTPFWLNFPDGEWIALHWDYNGFGGDW